MSCQAWRESSSARALPGNLQPQVEAFQYCTEPEQVQHVRNALQSRMPACLTCSHADRAHAKLAVRLKQHARQEEVLREWTFQHRDKEDLLVVSNLILSLLHGVSSCSGCTARLINAVLTNAGLTNAGLTNLALTNAGPSDAGLSDAGLTWHPDWAPAVDERACQCVSDIAVCLGCPSSAAGTCYAAAVHETQGLMPSPVVHLGPNRVAHFACCKPFVHRIVQRLCSSRGSERL